jgi:S-adenosylmethionine decarboxylase
MQNVKKYEKSAGIHILLDFWGAKNINSVKFVRKALLDAVKASKFTLLKIDLHKFSPQGVSGVAIIAESHVSIHTWPEYEFVALDIFVCGGKNPKPALNSLKKSFKPKKVIMKEIERGEFKHLL